MNVALIKNIDSDNCNEKLKNLREWQAEMRQRIITE